MEDKIYMDTSTILKPTETAQECVATHLVCASCNKPFKVIRKWQKFCSNKCRFIFWDKKHPRTNRE